MIYGYARVSTKGQAKDGYGLEVQEKLLREAGVDIVYSDSYTGTELHRPEFDKLMAVIEEGDTFIAAKLDRIARKSSVGMEIVSSLLDNGVNVRILDFGLLESTPAGKMQWQMMLVIAEYVRNDIVSRTQEGKAIARLNPDFTEGRPRLEVADFPLYLDKVREGKMTKTEAAERLGISRQTFYNMEARLG